MIRACESCQQANASHRMRFADDGEVFFLCWPCVRVVWDANKEALPDTWQLIPVRHVPMCDHRRGAR